ncbi:synaptobrevin-domain-containing protein [Protomyces lactucae-debilis]|uniref:Synaptobrevin homolog YKT6 n=1 Tax=Protomyces lactucae-debilis TaxID=2754530 RepID=A0A1Y2FSG8_PROLT|nr:synaptobrevin-domain-containing protein [Protomyces lactucae-debilis]ORY86928.1 synaptobrevin-domain-containing protein [Protomyces lactucae-debilis]
MSKSTHTKLLIVRFDHGILPAPASAPALLYLAVAKGDTLLATHANGTQNASNIATSILNKLDRTTDAKQTFVHKNYAIHVLHIAQPFPPSARTSQSTGASAGLTFLAMATESLGRRIPFACLLDMKRQFLETYSQAEVSTAGSYEFKAFDTTLAELAQQWTQEQSQGGAGVAREVQRDLDAVKQVMTQNIERVLERGERIDLLVVKTAVLNASSVAFRKKSTIVKRQMGWQNIRTTALVALVLLVLVYLLIGTGCGLPGWHRCL